MSEGKIIFKRIRGDKDWRPIKRVRRRQSCPGFGTGILIPFWDWDKDRFKNFRTRQKISIGTKFVTNRDKKVTSGQKSDQKI